MTTDLDYMIDLVTDIAYYIGLDIKTNQSNLNKAELEP